LFAASVPVTEKVKDPTLLLSIGAPFGTEPLQAAIPAMASEHE